MILGTNPQIMRDEILDHYNDQDIRNIYIKRDVAKWQKHLSAIKEEITFYDNLLNALIVSTNNSLKEAAVTLKASFEKVNLTNVSYLDNLIDYRNQTDNINECQDMQCEKFFLNSHEEFTENIEAHLDHFRSLKAKVRELFTANLEIRIS